MQRFIEGVDRNQSALLPECLDDFVVDDNAVRVIDVNNRLTGVQLMSCKLGVTGSD